MAKKAKRRRRRAGPGLLLYRVERVGAGASVVEIEWSDRDNSHDERLVVAYADPIAAEQHARDLSEQFAQRLVETAAARSKKRVKR